jgi:hypothetical protein
MVQALDAESRFEIAVGLRGSALQLAQHFPRRGVATIYELLFAARIGDPFRLSARAMKIQVGIEAALIEPVDVLGMYRGDVTVAAGRRFADNRVSCTGTTLGRR